MYDDGYRYILYYIHIYMPQAVQFPTRPYVPWYPRSFSVATPRPESMIGAADISGPWPHGPALEVTPDNHPDRPLWLNNLGI